MSIFDVLSMIGGLCLFLFGMTVMGEGLERRAGSSLKGLLGKLTNNRLMGFLTGMGVTAVIQSSSATTVMVVGFVNSKVMTLKQSIGVIMGANIGTTVTAWILSLGDISSDNIFMALLKPTSFTPVLALIGTAFMMFGKTSNKKDMGSILLGFATLMFGMDAMSDSVSGLADVPAFQNLFLLFENPILGVLMGAVLTAVIQSSSASVGILQVLSATGAVSYAAAIPIIMGQNIGTCVTSLISSVGTNKNARRAAMVHLSFNVVGTVVCLILFAAVSALAQPAILGESASYLGIAACHTLFNLLCTALLMPMSGLLEKLAYVLVPEDKQAEQVVELDERLLATPVFALEQSYQVVKRMAAETVEGFRLSLDALRGYSPEAAARVRKLEGDTDHYEDILGTYLTRLGREQVSDRDSAQITMILKVIGDFERISDHSVNVVESAEELREKKIELSDSAKEELGVMCAALGQILDTTLTAFLQNDAVLASSVEPLEQVIDDLKTALRNRHVVRLKDGECTVEAGFIWSDLLTNLERTADHCSNIAISIIDQGNQNMNAHQAVKRMKADTEAFQAQYRAYAETYSLHQ